MWRDNKTFEKHCRWCGRSYYANKPTDRDGFHSAACKQAHHRAYKKYVTAKHQAGSQVRRHQVTPKKKYITGKTGWNRPGPAHQVTPKKKKK